MSRGPGQVERDVLAVLELQATRSPGYCTQEGLVDQLAAQYLKPSVRRAINGLVDKGRVHKTTDTVLGVLLSLEPIQAVDPRPATPGGREVVPRDPRTDLRPLIVHELTRLLREGYGLGSFDNGVRATWVRDLVCYNLEGAQRRGNSGVPCLALWARKRYSRSLKQLVDDGVVRYCGNRNFITLVDPA